MSDEDTSSRGKICPLLRAVKCTPTLGCAWWDATLATCCVRAIADLMHSVYGKGG